MKMKKNKQFKKLFLACITIGTISASIFPQISYAEDLIPAENGRFYYRIGGGQDFPMPANLNSQTINLSVTDGLGLGYNCGAFNPFYSITNTLNDVKNSVENIDQNIVTYATSAISQFAMYELARNDPNAFNILNNNLMGAHKLLSLSIKSCETMQSQAAKGVNPFTDWVTVSMGNDWKQHMANAVNNPNDQNQADVNQAKQQVEQNNGSTGIPWLGGQNAGGSGQQPINVIKDTVVAGYNTIIGGGRSDNDLSPPAKNSNNEHLVKIWSDPTTAANWVVNIVGDQMVTTCNGCNKGSTPGLGLLPANQALAATLTTQLQQLVTGQQTLNEQTLKSVSAPGVVVNSEVIRAIENMSPNQQAIIISKLAQDIASAKVIDQALLAKRMLQTGSRVPEIYSNQAAQKSIEHAITDLNQDMQNLSFDVDMRRKVVSSTISDILENQQTEAAGTRATPSVPNNAAPMMQDGAVIQQQNSGQKH